MAARYIVSGATLTLLRAQLERLPDVAAIGFYEGDQTVRIIDPATGDELTLGTYNGAVSGIVLAQGKIIVGDAGGAGAAVDVSGDATIDDAGAVTVVEVGGEVAADIAAAAVLVAAISTVNVASPEIWNDAGVLKVGTV